MERENGKTERDRVGRWLRGNSVLWKYVKCHMKSQLLWQHMQTLWKLKQHQTQA